jgi:hypothetical protein
VTSAHRSRLEALVARGQEIRERSITNAPHPDVLEQVRDWQRGCAAIVNELSAGSKAHWLSREYSDALLVRSPAGQAVEDSPVAEIVSRVLRVLDRAARSLAQLDANSAITTEAGPRRFDFVHDAQLRPVLELAYRDSRDAFERGRFGAALVTTCSVLEAIVTDALIHSGSGNVDSAGGPEGPVTLWPFETRLVVAERAGVTRGGCARLPPIARRYADLIDATGELRLDANVSEREARLARQVLHVVMRDLDPGR